MLKELSKKGKFIFLFIFTFLISCTKQGEKLDLFGYKKNNFCKYEFIYKKINDTLTNWIIDSVFQSKYFRLSIYQLDSCIFFNKDSSQLFTTLNKSNQNWKNAIADNIEELGGAKIHGKWYFFFGASLVVPREMYSDKIYEPLSFERLSEVAHQQLHSKFWRKDSTGKYAPNERLFNTYLCPLPNGSWEDKPKRVVDSLIVIFLTQKRQKKLDPKEIAQIKAEMAASRRPLEPRRTWFGLGGYRKDDLENPRYPED